MSFKRLDPEDLVLSADTVVTPAWSTGGATLTTFYTSSTQASSTSGGYYLNIYQTGSTDASAEVQFSIAYGEKYGSGSTAYNSSVVGKSPSSTVYGQYRTLLLGDEDTDFSIAGTYPSKGVFAISVNRSRYKEKLKPGSLAITLSGSLSTLNLVDDSSTTATVSYSDAGRVYNIVNSGGSTQYGKFYPDAGIVVLSVNQVSSSIGLPVNVGSSVTNGYNNGVLYNTLKSFTLNSEETITSNYVFVRARNSEFNYTSNPSAITGSGELRFAEMINTPQTYITTIGLYNDNNDLLAIAKLSSPLLKDFTKEALVRIKLDF